MEKLSLLPFPFLLASLQQCCMLIHSPVKTIIILAINSLSNANNVRFSLEAGITISTRKNKMQRFLTIEQAEYVITTGL
jgi:hypothetical protein